MKTSSTLFFLPACYHKPFVQSSIGIIQDVWFFTVAARFAVIDYYDHREHYRNFPPDVQQFWFGTASAIMAMGLGYKGIKFYGQAGLEEAISFPAHYEKVTNKSSPLRNGQIITSRFLLILFPSDGVKNTRRSGYYACVFAFDALASRQRREKKISNYSATCHQPQRNTEEFACGKLAFQPKSHLPQANSSVFLCG